MAKVTNNGLVDGLSGKLCGIVFRTRNGKTIACAPPRKNRNKKPTAQKLQIQNNFKKYVQYAKWSETIPELKQQYAAKAKDNQSAFNLAFKDAAHPPKIGHVRRMEHTFTKASTGEIIKNTEEVKQQCLFIDAKDDFKVELVHVEIFTEDGLTLLEAGPAREEDLYIDWIYVLQPATAKHDKLKVFVTAIDLPGNNTQLEIIC